MNFIDIARDVLEVESQALRECAENLDDSIIKAVECIYQLHGKLVIIGVGKSGLVGAKIAATLASTGTPSFFIHPTEALHGDLGMIGSNDGVLAISYSGESDELVKILPHIKRFGVPLISMTRNPHSTLGRFGDIVLNIHVNKEACPLGIAPTSSTTLTMALGDALAVCLMEKRGFKKEDFASFHPGGSLGRQLFVKASDFLRTQHLPIVAPSSPLKEAIVVMSEGKLGSVLVCEKDKLVAILSDGDLRRALMMASFSLDNPVSDYATQHFTKAYDTTILAGEALALIEQKKIQLLPFVDEHNCLQGVLHIHDLVEAGIN